MELLANVAERSSAGCLGNQKDPKGDITRRCKLKHIKNHAVGQNMTLGNLIGIGLLGFVVPFLNFCCPKGMFLHVSWLQKTASNFTGTSFPEAFIHISAHQVLPCVCVCV